MLLTPFVACVRHVVSIFPVSNAHPLNGPSHVMIDGVAQVMYAACLLASIEYTKISGGFVGAGARAAALHYKGEAVIHSCGR